jgi:hypothetical protein
VQFNLLLLHLVLKRFQLGNCSIEVRLRIVEVCFADNSRGLQLYRTLQIHLCQAHICFLGYPRGFLAVDRCFLLERIDLQQWRTRCHTIT